MKAITIWQPWASLIACEAKKYETRSWATQYRGVIAIHAAAKRPSSIWEAIGCIVDKVRAALGIIDPDDLPRGCIIATAELVGCWKMHRNSIDGSRFIIDEAGRAITIYPPELEFGDWTTGRYAWELANVKMLPEPIPVKGMQRLWNWDGDLHGHR
jgi:hypothetical protein